MGRSIGVWNPPTDSAFGLLVVDGLEWGRVGAFHFDLVAALLGGELGPRSGSSIVISIVVGLAAIHGVYLFRPIAVGEQVTTAVDSRDARR